MDSATWFQLVILCFLGAVSPGPSLALVIGNTLTRGRGYGVATGLGHAVGIGWWAFLTALGIAELMMNQAGMLLAMQSFGAFLLGYIGFRTMSARDSFLAKGTNKQPTNSRFLFKAAGEGFLISLFNPKIALFFLAIFSHLVHSDANLAETGLMGIAAAAIDACWYVTVALTLTGSNLINILRYREPVIRKISGSILMLFAIYLLGVTIFGLL
ncbi:MAG: hypothetical protein BZY82_02255 [SAR202 cluster bacterium Io17-Chloro-G3]|nr:MAG: hypothetical protein BZY82_02255 [SAR202 cluster bacterium Io17-Chloro-G3]